jgi:HEAT repeat protein
VHPGLALSLLLSLAPTAKPAAHVARDTIEPKLRRYHPDPAGWRALGPGTDEALIEIARDGKAEIVMRSRAVSTLAYFATPASRKFLEATIDGKATSANPDDHLLLRKAAVALGWLGGTQAPDRLAPLLASEDPEVRFDAAVGLGLTRLPAAAKPLRRRLDIEPVDRVRAQISRQIQVIETAAGPPPPKK